MQQWLGAIFLWDLRNSYREGIAALRRAIGTRTFRYERPWYVLLGPSGAGKTTILRTLVAPHPFIDSGLLNWGIFRNGVVLDMAGRYALSDDKTAWYDYRHRLWRTFLRLMLYYRERRPLDGIVLVIPLHDFAHWNESQQVSARLLANRILSICRRTGMIVPVYVVVTHADQLEGYDAFVEALPREQRQQILGWNSPYAPGMCFTRSWAQEAIGSVLDRLSSMQLELLPRTPAPAALFSFYDSVARLLSPAEHWLDALFGRPTQTPMAIFRGLYLVGTPALTEGSTDSSTGQLDLSTSPPLYFTTELFRTKIFCERGIAQPIHRHLVRRNYLSIATHIATAIVIIGMITALAIQWKGLVHRATTLQKMLEQVRDERHSYRYEREKLRNPYYYADKTRQYLAYFATLEQNRLFSHGLPPSWLGTFHNQLRQVLAQSIREVVITGMREEFLRRAQLITAPTTTYFPTDTLNLRRYNLATTPEYIAFSRYVQAVTEFEYHAGLYNTLAAPHRDQRLAKVIDYLYQTSIEPDVAQLIESDYRLMQQVQIEPVHIEQLHPRFAEKALAMVEHCTDRAMTNNAVTSSLAAVVSAFTTVCNSNSDNETAEAFAKLALSLDRLAAALRHPDTEWMSHEAFVPDLATKKLLERIVRSRLLGGTIRAIFERRMDSLFTAMRLQLLTSTILMHNESSDSTTIVFIHPETKRLQLTPLMEKTAAAFVEWRKQPFAIIDGMRQRISMLAEQLGPFQHIVWNATLLKTITPTVEAYLKFLNDGIRLFPPELQMPGERVLQRGLQQTIQDIVVRSASLHTAFGSSGEDQLSTETQSILESAPHLTAALRQLSISSDGSGQQLATILGRQVARLLGTLSEWLADRQLYSISITDTKLLQWRPNQSIRALAFELETIEDTQEYLARQREPIEQWCKQYAVPLLNFYTSAGIAPSAALSTHHLAQIRQWTLITRALEGYATKMPNNSLAKLEEFIIGLGNITMQTPVELQKVVVQRVLNTQDDYFARKIRDIANDIRRGIIANAGIRLQEDYRKVYRATTAVQRYFPFGASEQDADPGVVRNYFTSIINEIVFARLLTALGGTIPDAHATVLSQLATAQEVFRPLIFAANVTSGTYSLTFTYRTNRTAEQNATVVYTKISIQSPNGQETSKLLFTPGEQATLSWRPGDYILIQIRWAKDANILPVPWLEGKYRLADPQTALFQVGGVWSLFRLLSEYQMPDPDLKHRLAFRVLTSGAVNSTATSDPMLVLFIDLDINASHSDNVPRLPLFGTLPAPR